MSEPFATAGPSSERRGQLPTDLTTAPDVSIVISTYNRCEQLRHALESLLSQEPDGVTWEAVVVDNNSTDDTPAVVESFRDRFGARLRYVFEPKQGLSFGRNAGISHAAAPLVAFTDDDVQPAADWVRRIKRCFDEHPEADFIGGKVLPIWPGVVPAWLTPDHWSPLALVDYGDEAFVVNPGKPILPGRSQPRVPARCLRAGGIVRAEPAACEGGYWIRRGPRHADARVARGWPRSVRT
jgi:glycosyltransferase involved in cell wall biosynthesis